MKYDFSADDVFEMAEQLEKNGAKFYRQAAADVSGDEAKTLLKELAAMEDDHEKTFAAMRAELAAIWERGTASREQMVSNLQDWIARAEASRIRALQEAALRIRSYAPAPA